MRVRLADHLTLLPFRDRPVRSIWEGEWIGRLQPTDSPLTRHGGQMEFRILGPLEVLDGDRAVELPGQRQRSLLALLLLHANQVVSSTG